MSSHHSGVLYRDCRGFKSRVVICRTLTVCGLNLSSLVMKGVFRVQGPGLHGKDMRAFVAASRHFYFRTPNLGLGLKA